MLQLPTVPEGPAWLGATGLIAWLIFSVVRESLRTRKSNGALSSLAGDLRQHFQSQVQALNAVTVTLTALTERLAQLPTRADVLDVARENKDAFRSGLRDALAPLHADIRELRRESS